MTINSPTAPDRKTEQATIAGIERGLTDVKTGRTVSHEAAVTSLRKIIDAAAGDIV